MTNDNNLSKTQVSALVAALISFVIAALAVFGYNVAITQPQITAMQNQLTAIEQTQQQLLGVVMAGQGEQGLAGQNVTGFNSVNVAQDLAVGGDLDVSGTTTLADVITNTTGIVVNVPTPQTTATPGVAFHNTGVNEPWIVTQNATPIARLNRLGVMTLGRSLTHGDQSAVTVTNGGTIAVTDDFVPLTAAGSVGTGTITGCNTLGKVTYLYNTANQTITITDTSTLKLAGNAALGQYDSLTLIGDGTNCVQVAKTDN